MAVLEKLNPLRWTNNMGWMQAVSHKKWVSYVCSFCLELLIWWLTRFLQCKTRRNKRMQIPLNWASLWISSSMTNSKLRPSLSGQTSVSFHWLTVSCNVNAYVLEKQIPFWYFLLICNWKKCKGLLKFLVTVMFWLSLIFRFLVAFI